MIVALKGYTGIYFKLSMAGWFIRLTHTLLKLHAHTSILQIQLGHRIDIDFGSYSTLSRLIAAD